VTTVVSVPEPRRSRIGRARPNDPGRRGRIIDAALDVVADVGVAGASHRRIAAAAGVPLGSMTYYFDGMGDLLHAAFTRFATTVSDQAERRMASARDTTEARRAIAAHITEDIFGTQRDLVLTHELYALAAREPAFRDITNAWMARSRRALERHFDRRTARMLDALVEGLSIHRALDTEPHDPAVVLDAVDRITRIRPA
jgi:DNA-binding transcriptional regulator YbjK